MPALSRIANANKASADDPSDDGSGASPGDTDSERKTDARPWFVKMVHRRSKGGVFFGVTAIAIGGFGSGVIRRNYAIGGSSLMAVGIATLIFALGLCWITSPRRPFWQG